MLQVLARTSGALSLLNMVHADWHRSRHLHIGHVWFTAPVPVLAAQEMGGMAGGNEAGEERPQEAVCGAAAVRRGDVRW